MKRNKKLDKFFAVSLLSLSLLSVNSYSFASSNLDVITEGTAVEGSSLEASPRGQSAHKLIESIGGRDYKNYTEIGFSMTGYTKGCTGVYPVSGTVGTGYLYAHANVYRASDNVVVSTADWRNNSNTASSSKPFENWTPGDGTKKTSYTKGTTKIYNGNTYVLQGANTSPHFTPMRNQLITSEISRDLELPEAINEDARNKISSEKYNERKHLYETKNMIPALGLDNIEGYITLDDLYDEDNFPKTLEEGIKYGNLKSTQNFRIIPLYDTDGENIIGQYRIDRGVTSEELDI